MKKYILYILVAVFSSYNIAAQIDRSKIPASGPNPEVNLGEASEFTLKNGLTVLVVTDHKLPSVNWSLNLNTPPVFEGDIAGVQSLTSSLLGKETLNTAKDEFSEKVEFLGARINVSLGGGFGFCLSKYKDEVFGLFAEAALQPKFTQKELDFERDQLLEGIKSGENSAAAIASDVRGALFYGKNHAAGEIVTKETVNKVTLQDVQDFYTARFKPSNGYMVFTGDITVKEVKSLLKTYFKDWKEGTIETPSYPDFNDVDATEINFVDVPNAVQTELAVMNVSPLKMSDKDYHAALITNYIFGGGFGSYLNMNLREANGYTYGARSSLGTGRYYNSSFRATTKVRNMVTDSAVVETLKEMKRIKTELVDDEILKNAKAKFLGSFILESEDKTVAARRTIRIKTNNLPADFYKNFIANINAVTKEDVKRVANTYFKDDKARIILVGKGSDVIPNLEKLGLPIKYFDKHANPIEKPVFSKEIPADVTAQSVIDHYFNAIGGKDKAQSVTSVFYTATVNGLAPFPLKAELKVMTPNNESMEMSADGMGVLMKQKWNGTTGYAEQQGRKLEMTEQQIADKKAAGSPLFPELNYTLDQLKLESIVAIDGNDNYKLKVTTNGKDSFRYYDVKTGFLTQTEAKTDANGKEITTVSTFKNYKAVGELMFPFKNEVSAGPQKLPFEFSEIKVNEGVTAADFE